MPLTAEVYLYIRGPLHEHTYMITNAHMHAPLSLVGFLHLVLTFIWGDHKWQFCGFMQYRSNVWDRWDLL